MSLTLSDLRRDSDYKNALCSVNKLCSFDLVDENHEVRIERCRFCNKTVYYRKISGRIDNRQYGRDHVRDILQCGSQLYEEIYGRRAEIKPAERITRDEYRYMAKDAWRTASRLEAKAMLD